MQVHSSSEEESVSSSGDSDESSDEVTLDEDSSDEERPSRKRPRASQTPKKTNGAKAEEVQRAAGSYSASTAAEEGAAPSAESQKTSNPAFEKKESPREPTAFPPLQSLSLLDRLRLGGGSSFSSSAPVRTKQLTLDEIFAPSGNSSSKPSLSSNPTQITSKAAETA